MQLLRVLPSPRPSPLLPRARLLRARHHLIWISSGRFSSQPIYTEHSRLELQATNINMHQDDLQADVSNQDGTVLK